MRLRLPEPGNIYQEVREMKTRSQSKFSQVVLAELWELHAQRARTLDELASTLGITAARLRLMFSKACFSTWSELDLREYHAQHLLGAFVSALAAKRHKCSADLIAAWKTIGLAPLNRNYKQPQAHLDPLVAEMHSLHLTGKSLADLGRLFHRDSSTIARLFKIRGLKILPGRYTSARRRPDGTYEPFIPMTEAEITALVEAATDIVVPSPLKIEWRKWNLARRGEFISRLRARLASPKDRPEAPFSGNVKPFDYASAEAWEIVEKLNAGMPSRYSRSKIDIRSQGVIFEGELWFWNSHGGGYFRQGGWTPENGRPSLHRYIWEKIHGSFLPGSVVIFRDGNPNNFSPANLSLATKNDICRVNHAKALHRKSIAKTNLILARSKRQSTEKNDLIDHLRTPR